jgi:hypothetical protein
VSKFDIPDWSPAAFFEITGWFGQHWSAEFPAVRLLTCKWRPEDLIPGLSDVDARLVCDEIGPEDWVRLDQLVYRTHLEISRQRPEWARKLEHTPGVCSTRSEVLDPALFQPEMRDWDFYWGDREWFNDIKACTQQRAWEAVDEYYFLAKRFVPWCTPYNREIDPAVNIPANILPKYALHSRLMHYFVPCVKAALSVINHAGVVGKRESLYRLAQCYPSEPVLREAIDMLDVHYEVPWLAEQPAWYAFEERLWQFIQKITPEVLRAVTIVDLGNDLSMDNLRRQLQQIPGEPMLTLYNGVRFSRIRKGRWQFYLEAPPHFDTGHLFYSEVSWLKSTFTAPVFDAYAQLKWGQAGLAPDEIINRLTPELLERREADIVRQVFAAAAGKPTYAEARERLRQASQVYADYYLVLERLLADTRRSLTQPHTGTTRPRELTPRTARQSPRALRGGLRGTSQAKHDAA